MIAFQRSEYIAKKTIGYARFKLSKYPIVALSVFMSSIVFGAKYEVPPTSSTSANVPYISDAAMEQCVKIYNEAKWLGEDIDRTVVNQYNQTSINTYNSKIDKHSRTIDYFNKYCAGKQSESAYRAAQKLNQ